MEFSKSAAPFRNWALGAGESAGTYNAPGLPNVAGRILAFLTSTPDYSGVIYADITPNNKTLTGNPGGWGWANLRIDASRGSAIYGGSATVMPPSIDMPVILYLGRPNRG